ncbi:methyl-accepting chemotaxis protein [Dactylosporangium sp. NPDC049525]|uniref:methyl-accepting chemotaxis protein n=1 Tax=Dactylosporangium sp. NPDC049525 TaxID=3154730 RepID=UPI003427459A
MERADSQRSRRQWLADQPVARKLVLLVLVCCAVGAVVLGVGVTSLGEVNTKAADLYRANLVPSSHLAAMNQSAMKVQNDVANLALSNGPVASKAFQDGIAAADATVDQELDAYRQTVRTTKQRQLLARFTIWWGAFRNIRDNRLLPLVAAGDIPGFQAAYLGDGATVTANAMGALSDLLAYEQASGRAGADDASDAYGRARVAMVVALLVGLAAALLLSRYLTGLIVRPIRRVHSVLTAVAAGDLTAEADIPQRDEVGDMARALNAATASTREAVRSLGDNSATLSAAAEELAAISRQIDTSATDANTRAELVARAANEVSEHVAAVANGATEMGGAIEEISRSTAHAATVTATAVSIAATTNETIGKLGASSGEIGEVIKVITSIAGQTNLLALNATIEAARAGDFGKGFAVVAQEVKDLARETARATDDIGKRVQAIQLDTEDAVAAIGQIGEVIAQMSEYQHSIAAAVEEQAVTARTMGHSVDEAAGGSVDIANNIAGVADATKSTNEGVTSTGEAVDQLARMASDMRVLVSRFTY